MLALFYAPENLSFSDRVFMFKCMCVIRVNDFAWKHFIKFNEAQCWQQRLTKNQSIKTHLPKFMILIFGYLNSHTYCFPSLSCTFFAILFDFYFSFCYQVIFKMNKFSIFFRWKFEFLYDLMIHSVYCVDFDWKYHCFIALDFRFWSDWFLLHFLHSL